MENSDFTLFRSLGLEGALKQIEKNPALGVTLKEVVACANIDPDNNPGKFGNLLYLVAANLPENRADKRPLLARYVVEGKLRSSQQVSAAIDFLKRREPQAAIDMPEFDAACGVGISFTDEDITARAAALVNSHRDEIKAQRFLFKPNFMNEARATDLRWADGEKLKKAIDTAFVAAKAELIGGRTPADVAADEAAKKSASGKASKSTAAAAAGGATGQAAVEPVKDDVFAARELASTYNTPQMIAEHQARTGGRLRTRFPPEPNGFLHIGHAKSMNLNFEGAFRALGKEPATEGATIFRYDDTNPEAETEEYMLSQRDNVEWLGWKPIKVTHSSDYFQQLYGLAIKLIENGKAYVCHMTKEEMERQREVCKALIDPAKAGGVVDSPNSPFRDRPISESVSEFRAMRDGRYREGEAVLRLKIDMSSKNPTMWDPVAYRIKHRAHPHTGSAWCIYPSYDFSHCIVDSLEDIDYSLCTLEFEVRRELYYWVLEQLGLFRPHVFEFSRLNLTYTVLSKRKILKLVNERRVRGWDDPRLCTINGLKRRGYTPDAINAFCRDIGVTRNENTVQMARLEHFCREDLDRTARRAFAVLRPLRVVLVNVAADDVTWLDAPDFPSRKDASAANHKIALTRVVYIERDDFRERDDKDYYGLAPGKTAGLRYAGYVTVRDVIRDASGGVSELQCVYDATRTSVAEKVKGNLHWVSSSVPGQEPAHAEVRLYDYLFTTEEPGSTGDWEQELNPQSETVLPGCYIDASLAAPGALKLWDHFQFERLGYFVVDGDSNLAEGKLVLNQTVSLKEDKMVKDLKRTK